VKRRKQFGVSPILINDYQPTMEEEMRTLSLKLALILLALAAASAVSVSGIAKNSNNNSAEDTTIVGYIGQYGSVEGTRICRAESKSDRSSDWEDN
jgi:hypothetical protein